MTKFILHGGETRVFNIYNKNFYREMLKAAKGKPILACYYSRVLKDWDSYRESDIERLQKATGQKNLEIVLASKDPKKIS